MNNYSINNCKILITGSTGYIGSNLTKKLVEDSNDVHVIVRPNSSFSLLKDIKNDISFHVFEGTTNQMISILKKTQPDLVFHLAASYKHAHTAEDLKDLINSNILFGSQLVEAMVRNNIYHLINTGTYWQHYQNKDYSPTCLYAATKQAFKDILKFYVETTELKVIILKLFDTYGPNDKRKKLFSQLREAIKCKTHLDMSPGEQLVDIVYIDDVIEAYKKAGEILINNKSTKYEEYLVTSGKHVPLKELVKTYFKILGEDANINWGERKYRQREVMVPWKKGKTLPNWKPKVMIEEGIRIMDRLK